MRRSKWDDRAYDQRLYHVEVANKKGWARMTKALPRNVASRQAADLFLSYHKERGVRIVPEIEQ